jgi:predicted transposase YdaD
LSQPRLYREILSQKKKGGEEEGKEREKKEKECNNPTRSQLNIDWDIQTGIPMSTPLFFSMVHFDLILL